MGVTYVFVHTGPEPVTCTWCSYYRPEAVYSLTFKQDGGTSQKQHFGANQQP